LRVRVSDNLLVALAAVTAVIAAVLSVMLPANPVTFVFAVALVFFLPGYALTRAIFDRGLQIDFFLLLSIGLSVVSTMIIALGLALLGVLTLETILVLQVGLTIIALLIDRIDHKENRRFEVEIVRPTMKDIDPVIAVVIAFSLILIGIFGFIILTTHPPSTTHVFIKDPADLPTNLTLGNAINITIQVHNGEGGAAQFGIAVNEANVTGIGPLSCVSSLENNETKDFSFSLTPTTVGYQQFRIEVTIDGKYYGEVHFWVNVV
jgi:uncharacterized membrane protein